MATGRTSNRMETQIQELYGRGYKIRAIARMLKLARPTVRKALGIGQEGPPEEEADWKSRVDWERVREELSKRGTTIDVLHREMCPQGKRLFGGVVEI